MKILLSVVLVMGLSVGLVAQEPSAGDLQAKLKAEQAKAEASEQRIKALEQQVAGLLQRVPALTADEQAAKRKQSHEEMCRAVGRKVDRVNIDLTSGTVTASCRPKHWWERR